MKQLLQKAANKNRIFEYLIYLLFRVYEQLRKLLFIFFGMKPIVQNKIVFSAMQGARYGDNPYYISEYIYQHFKDKYDIVWLLNPNVKDELPIGIRRVDNSDNLAVIRELATAKVWVDSNTKYSGFIKREGQLYVQTWHGSYGLKKTGLDLGKLLPLIDKRNMLYNSAHEDVVVSNSKHSTEVFRRGFGYSGFIIENGSPRNDMLFLNTPEINQKVREYFELPSNVRFVMYAPTFRNDYRTDSMKLDFQRLRETLEDCLGGKWVVLVRLHYKNIKDAADFIKYSDTIINATDYSNMQELLYASDILITDYSSCMFDFATTGKTCFIYASDLEKYNHDRGNYFTMDELPFPLAENNDQLEHCIRNFNSVEYKRKLDALFSRVGLNETGHATESVAQYIVEWMRNN